VATGGIVAGVGVLLWAHRRRLAALGILVAFIGLALPWFVDDGYEERFDGGRPVCCGHVIDRGPLRTSIAVGGVVVALVLVTIDAARSRRR
jgi:hypothetical protein